VLVVFVVWEDSLVGSSMVSFPALLALLWCWSWDRSQAQGESLQLGPASSCSLHLFNSFQTSAPSLAPPLALTMVSGLKLNLIPLLVLRYLPMAPLLSLGTLITASFVDWLSQPNRLPGSLGRGVEVAVTAALLMELEHLLSSTLLEPSPSLRIILSPSSLTLQTSGNWS
jgi:hypothetical protein